MYFMALSSYSHKCHIHISHLHDDNVSRSSIWPYQTFMKQWSDIKNVQTFNSNLNHRKKFLTSESHFDDVF
jgi:hypothetical protein